MKIAPALSVVSFLALSTLACSIEVYDPPPRTYGSGSSGDPVDGTQPASPSPVLVEIDTNAKLEADPGEGVGVFAEYASGGKWHLFWACDTNQTKKECDYQVRVQSAAGKVSNVVDEAGKPIATTGGDIVLRRTIGTRNDGIRFDGPPGGVVTVEVTLDGRADNVLFFFVQDGKLNGGYEGTLTNPIKLQGKTP